MRICTISHNKTPVVSDTENFPDVDKELLFRVESGLISPVSTVDEGTVTFHYISPTLALWISEKLHPEQTGAIGNMKGIFPWRRGVTFSHPEWVNCLWVELPWCPGNHTSLLRSTRPTEDSHPGVLLTPPHSGMASPIESRRILYGNHIGALSATYVH